MGRKLHLLPTEVTRIEDVALRVVRRICGMQTRPKRTALYGTSLFVNFPTIRLAPSSHLTA